MLVLGLTGNIGCGKSSLSEILSENKFKIIDADLVSREIMDDEDLLRKIYLEFGTGVKDEDGKLNRKKLGGIVFGDDVKLRRLNELTHPVINKRIMEYIETYRYDGEEVVVVDGALLIEGGFTKLVDKVLLVVCDEAEQIKRVMNRDSLTKEEALKRIESQMAQNEKLKYADYAIDNSDTAEELCKEACKFMNYMKENWCE
ncbi:MAG: dephospho-CoA kinase [Clostridioides sp.]|jgi:dephospho-CoA kinase|nr:dephospho-CoA kinase [Clostridioides sp.]